MAKNWYKKEIQNQKYAHEEWINLNRFLEEQSPVQKADQQDNDQNKMSREFPSNKYYPFSAYYQNGQLAWLSSMQERLSDKTQLLRQRKFKRSIHVPETKKSGLWAYYKL